MIGANSILAGMPGKMTKRSLYCRRGCFTDIVNPAR